MVAQDWKSVRSQAHLWRAKRQEGLEAREENEFQHWINADPCHGEAYAEAVIAWEGAGQPGFERDLKSVMVEQDFRAEQKQADIAVLRRPWLGHAIGGIGAISVLIVAAVFVGLPDQFFGQDMIEYQRYTGADGKTTLINLPDQSVITLGPDAVLDFALTDTQRRGRLIDGDAFFHVASNPSRPFIIETDIADIEVTGTTFDLQLQNERLSVAVGEGSVRLDWSKGHGTGSPADALALTAGEGVQVSKDKGFSSVTTIYPAELAAWRRGRLTYRNAPLAEVVADLNLYSDIPIRLDPAANDLRINGGFDAKNMDFALAGLAETLPVRIVREQEEILITSK